MKLCHPRCQLIDLPLQKGWLRLDLSLGGSAHVAMVLLATSHLAVHLERSLSHAGGQAAIGANQKKHVHIKRSVFKLITKCVHHSFVVIEQPVMSTPSHQSSVATCSEAWAHDGQCWLHDYMYILVPSRSKLPAPVKNGSCSSCGSTEGYRRLPALPWCITPLGSCMKSQGT